MDFTEHASAAAHRSAARAWADEHVHDAWIERERTTGTYHTPELHAELLADGIIGAGWPPDYGGTDVDPGFARAVFDELERRHLHTAAWGSTGMVCRTLLQSGTEEQKREYVGGALRGEVLVALGYTEPESGSDVAAARTSAARDGADWVINGQKMFTSTAEACTHVFLLTRTNAAVAKHKGLTMFLVPTKAPGVEIRPVYTLGGQRTNATYYADVRVPDSYRVGPVDGGWGVMHVALVYERGAASRSSKEQHLASDLAAWALRATAHDGSRVFDDPQVAERIARVAVDEEVTRLLSWKLRHRVDSGELPGVEASMRKLFSATSAQRHYADALDILAAQGVLAPGAPDAPGGGLFEAGFRAEAVTTIYGGSSEIQREIIAERRLGLPRNRPRA